MSGVRGSPDREMGSVGPRRRLSVWLVLRTYNEAENLERIVARALPQLEQAAERRTC